MMVHTAILEHTDLAIVRNFLHVYVTNFPGGYVLVFCGTCIDQAKNIIFYLSIEIRDLVSFTAHYTVFMDPNNRGRTDKTRNFKNANFFCWNHLV